MIKIKNEADIAKLRQSGRKLAIILDELKQLVKPGVSSAFLEEQANLLCEREGGRPAFKGYKPRGSNRPFPSALCLSVNDTVVHGIPQEKPFEIEEGDIVTLDMGFIYDGMITDSAITIGVGEIDKSAEKLLEAGAKCLDAGIFAAQVGNKTGDIGHAIGSELEYYRKTFGFNMADGLGGHGVGYEVHEDPFVPNFSKPNQGVILQEGLVIAIEPIVNEKSPDIYLDEDGYTIRTADGKRSVHFEHTILITKDGPEILTKI